MKYSIFAGVLVVIFSLQGCSSIPMFPSNGSSEAVESTSEFGVLIAKPDAYTGRAIKMAGKIVGVERSGQSTVVFAEWLPYPALQFAGPDEPAPSNGRRFTVLYPGQVDAEGSLHGNKFLVIGDVKGTKSMITLEGISKEFPHIVARCLHVWKSGDDEIEQIPDFENTGYPVAQQTYCSRV